VIAPHRDFRHARFLRQIAAGHREQPVRVAGTERGSESGALLV